MTARLKPKPPERGREATSFWNCPLRYCGNARNCRSSGNLPRDGIIAERKTRVDTLTHRRLSRVRFFVPFPYICVCHEKRPAVRRRKPLISYQILVGSASFELATPAV